MIPPIKTQAMGQKRILKLIIQEKSPAIKNIEPIYEKDVQRTSGKW